MTLTAKLYRRGQWQSDEEGNQSVTDIWEVIADSETATITDVLAATGLPTKGDAHPEKASAIYNGDASGDHDSEVLTRWLISFRFSTRLRTRENEAYNAQRTKGGMKSGFKMVPAFFDSRGYPLVNTAGDLYEGLTRKRRLRVVNVTHNFVEIPTWFFSLADTINAAAVTILGTEYPPGTCLLTDIDFPDEPERDPDGTLYWPVTYRIEIDPDGYYIILPNRGPHEYVYQTRPTADDEFADTDKATYDAEDSAEKKRKIKRRIQTEEGQDVADNIWLDGNGQAKRVLSLTDSSIGIGQIAEGSTTLTLQSGTFDADLHKNALIRVDSAGGVLKPLITQIVSCSGTSATLAAASKRTVTNVDIWVSGALCNYFVLEDLADWSDVPLPNNHPGA